MASVAKYGEDIFVEVEKYRIHYVEFGAGDPVILIPGSFSTYRAFNRIIPLLSDHYRLLAPDYVGTGDSDKPKEGFGYTIEEQADLIAEMIDKLELGRAHLVGASYGGAIALNLAARYPDLVDKVVSIEGGVVRPEELPGDPMEFLLRYPIIGDLFIGTVRTGLLNPVLLRLVAGKWYPQMASDDTKEMLEQLSYNAKSASRIPWHRVSMASRTSTNFEEEAKSIGTPVLYLYGEESDFREILVDRNIKFLETHLPNARIVGLEGGIHDLALQKPREVAGLILDFFGED